MGATLTQKTKRAVKRRDGQRCQAGGLFFTSGIGCSAPLTIHHRFPRYGDSLYRYWMVLDDEGRKEHDRLTGRT